jgi:predicted HTH transcriptional regulator
LHTVGSHEVLSQLPSRRSKFDEGQWTYLGDAQDVERSEARQGILELLRQAEGPMTPKAIAHQLGKNAVTIRRLLMKMLDKGEVKSPAAGYYISAPDHPTPPERV